MNMLQIIILTIATVQNSDKLKDFKDIVGFFWIILNKIDLPFLSRREKEVAAPPGNKQSTK